ncbi:unnamed protein product [Danaus chrysippus]|uniref:(African queen) hypothetical protein n=1 Tax=Danaus chrysippus TaxID=151541 RepID=A0A8J2QPS6_9NEOP|nr:unnamed protein product [Danaus chrysippus]
MAFKTRISLVALCEGYLIIETVEWSVFLLAAFGTRFVRTIIKSSCAVSTITVIGVLPAVEWYECRVSSVECRVSSVGDTQRDRLLLASSPT